MAKQIIILDRVNEPSDMNFRYVMWAAVPTGRNVAYANPDATSAYKGADATELAAIQDGSVVERQELASFPIGTPMATIQQYLITQFNAFQNHITNRNPTVRYGTFYDGTAWTSGGTT
jgi:hypothetical protein